MKRYNFIVLVFIVAIANAAINLKIDPELLQTFKIQQETNIVVKLHSKNHNILKEFSTHKISDRAGHIKSIVSALKNETSSTQKPIVDFIHAINPRLVVKTFWISNLILIESADIGDVQELSRFDAVDKIYEDKPVLLNPDYFIGNNYTNKITKADSWSIIDIKAPEAWAISDGTGALVGTMDTGVRYTHEALIDNYIGGDYGWLDPYSGSLTPEDTHGVGTHIMGNIVGKNGIGVAPGAKWMSCRACESASCTTSAIVECGQFLICPDSNCSQAPDLISTSIGPLGPYFDDIFAAWQASGIISFYPAVGSGDCPNMVGVPASPGIITTGYTLFNGNLAPSSGQGGIGSGNVIKPDIVAPGELVLSAGHLSDDSYTELSGRSMSSSHSIGVGALIKSINPGATKDEVKEYITRGAAQNVVPPTGVNCGGIDETTYPNNAVGWGKLDAYQSVLLSSKK